MQQKLRALASTPRLKIIKKLLENDEYTCVCQIDNLDKDRSVIYRHFKKLEDADLLETRKQGRRVEAKIKNPEKMRKFLEIVEEV